MTSSVLLVKDFRKDIRENYEITTDDFICTTRIRLVALQTLIKIKKAVKYLIN